MENGSPTQKALLHDHLDGSFPIFGVLPELFRLNGKEYPFKGTQDEQHKEIKELFNNVQIDLVQKFANTTGVMQSRETLALAAKAYTEARAQQGFLYCEATIAPQYHTISGLSEAEVIEAVIGGIKEGERLYPETEVNLIFAIGRELNPERSIELIEIASDCDRDYVVGVGLVCDEAANPPGKHIEAFRLAKKRGFKITIHAGEWVHLPPDAPDPERDRNKLFQNILVAIMDLRADRIGHAIPLAYSRDLTELAAKNKIGVELCPGSNLASGLIPNTSYLRIRDLLKAGVLCSINPDDDLFLPDYFETMDLCQKEYSFTEMELAAFNHGAWTTRFGNRKHEYPRIWD